VTSRWIFDRYACRPARIFWWTEIEELIEKPDTLASTFVDERPQRPYFALARRLIRTRRGKSVWWGNFVLRKPLHQSAAQYWAISGCVGGQRRLEVASGPIAKT